MPEALLLSLPIVGGFLATTRLHVTRFRLARTSGYRLYFTIIHYALYLTAVSIFVVQFVWALSAMIGIFSSGALAQPDLLKEIGSGLVGTLENHKWAIAVGAFVIGHFSHRIYNSDEKKRKFIAIAIEDQDFELMVAKSQAEKNPMLITLDTGKVYLGWAVKGPNPELQRRWIRILPWASGYRNEQQSVRFTTDYTEIIDKIERKDQDLIKALGRKPDVTEFEVVLPIDNIVSAHLFDVKAYRFFAAHGTRLFGEMAENPTSAS